MSPFCVGGISAAGDPASLILMRPGSSSPSPTAIANSDPRPPLFRSRKVCTTSENCVHRTSENDSPGMSEFNAVHDPDNFPKG